MAESKRIGVLYTENAGSGLTHDFFAGVLDGVRRQLDSTGYHFCFFNVNSADPKRKSYKEQYEENGFIGVIICCVNYIDPEVSELLDSGVPVAVIDEEMDGVVNVLSDNVQGIKNMVHYLIEKGHKKIAYIIGDDTTVTKVRLKSFLEACEEHGISIPNEYILRAAYRDMTTCAYYTEELLRLQNPPTCIMFPDDYAAIGGMNIIRSRGLDIPADISIVGYDGIQIMSKFEPALTTIRQQSRKMGEIAAKQLIARIEDPSLSSTDTILVETVIEKGRTVAKVYG